MNQDILEKCKEILNQKVVDAGMQAEDVSLGTQRTRSRDISFSVTGVSGFWNRSFMSGIGLIFSIDVLLLTKVMISAGWQSMWQP